MHANGFEIGSHTMSHANLERMDAEASYKEIHKSKLILEAMLNKPIISFCYPYGLLNKRVKKQVRRAGYEFACSSYSGPAKFNEDLSEIRRMEIDNSISLWGFLIRLLMPFEYVEWAWWKTKHKNGK